MSVQADYDQGTKVTVQGYASLWQWSRGKVSRFLNRIGVDIQYPEGTQNKRNKRGHITIHKADISKKKNEHIRLIDSKWLAGITNINEQVNGHKTDIRQGTTKDPNPNPQTYCVNFLRFWDVFADKRGKEPAWNVWKKLSPNEQLSQEIISGAERYAAIRDHLVKKGQTPKMAQGWLKDRRWEDEFIEAQAFQNGRIEVAETYRSYQCT